MIGLMLHKISKLCNNYRSGAARQRQSAAGTNPVEKLGYCRGSGTLRRWVGIELSPTNHRALFIPGGCAHGFLTLEDDSEVFYMMGESHVPELARGVRWDDSAFGVRWPF